MRREETMSRQHESGLRYVAEGLDESLELAYGKRMGFALVVFPFGAGGVGDYISNGSREDIIKAIRETADRLEANEFIPATRGEA